MTEKTLKSSGAILPQDYQKTLTYLKKRIQQAQAKAILAANKELILAYWDIGKIIAERQETGKWGTGIIEKLSRDFQNLFPGQAGFSPRNLIRMHAFYAAYENLPQVVAELESLPVFHIPWGHNALILEKLKDTSKRLWYAQKTVENGWSRAALEGNIKSKLFDREGKAITNFGNLLMQPQSGMAQEAFKDPYIFDFLELANEHTELDVERGLIQNVQKTLLELGKGFALVGRQYHLQVSDSDFYIDLLFYHTKLHCYIVVELKARKFDPRDVGQLQFYLSVVDDQLRTADDKQTIGLLLCKTKDNIIAEYALRDLHKPIGIAGYETELVSKLPKELKGSLPTVEELEAEFEKNKVLDEEL